MAVLLDTDIVIHLRDANSSITERLAGIGDELAMSTPTMIELQAGLADPAHREERRANVTRIAQRVKVLPLNTRVVSAYGMIVETSGYSRTRIFDRLIAATALVHDLTLVTINGADFRDVPDLKLEVWPAPAQ